MFIYRSNRTERLLAELAAMCERERPDPFTPETIVVQSQGMAHWLSLRLSEHFSVWANPSFPFPRAIIEQAFDALLGPPEHAVLERDALSLAIAARLPQHLDRPAFAPLARYLRGDEGGDRLMPLAARIGAVFDDYAVFREDLVHGYSQGTDPDDWQSILLQELATDFGAYHVGARQRAFLSALERHRGPLPGFPRRLALFGVSSLPPMYVRIFAALARHVSVHFFLLSPTSEFWADLRSVREQERERRRGGAGALAHVEEGHVLLASLGKLGRDLFSLLESEVPHYASDVASFEDPGPDTLLHALQSDILHVRARGPSSATAVSALAPGVGASAPQPKLPIAARDDTLRINICHSPMREVEVLHDQLVAVLRDSEVSPSDIVVMAPDIEAYAPAIGAVFGQTTGRARIPFRIADRGLLSSHPLLDALLLLLDALSGRLEAPTVLDVLALVPVRCRFAIAEEELEIVRDWVDLSGIRWGVDAEHRAEVSQPALAGNTWRFGLERLILGYAMEGHGDRLFAGRLPYDDMEGGVTGVLGRFCEFCETLFHHRKQLSGAHPVAVWRSRIVDLIESTLMPDAEGQAELSTIHEALDGLVVDAERTGFVTDLGLGPLRRLVLERIARRRGGVGFMAGGVTFCQLLPMRSIPFCVVALLGMDDGVFPRKDGGLSFDKRLAAPRLGDRSVREDDRYMFLEALLAARSRFIISYVGRGVHDNSLRPPSVLVSELLDAIDTAYVFEAGDARAALCVEHRLQPFSPAYFGAGSDPRLVSYASHYYEGAVSLASTARAAPTAARATGSPERRPGLAPFVSAPLPAPAVGGPLALALLERYLSHPLRTFLQDRLGIFLGRDASPLQAREPMQLDALARWQVAEAMLHADGGDRRLHELAPAFAAAGQLPLGVPGELAYEDLVPQVTGIARERGRWLSPPRSGVDRRALSIAWDGHRIEGELAGLAGDVHVVSGFSRVARRNELSVWLHHVLLNLVAERDPEGGWPRTSVLVGRAGKEGNPTSVEFSPVADPQQVARGLLTWVERARCQPLPFAAEASRAYVAASGREGGTEAALGQARRTFEGEYGEGADPYVAQVYPDFDALVGATDPSFSDAATGIYADLFAHRSESSGP